MEQGNNKRMGVVMELYICFSETDRLIANPKFTIMRLFYFASPS